MQRQTAKSGAKWVFGIVPALFAFCTLNRAMCADAPASSDPLLDLFIKKGYVTEDEAQKVKTEYDALRTNTPAAWPSESKWKISDGIKSVELFGDLRVRYEGRNVTDPSGGRIDLNRYRYAVRLGLRGDVMDDFYYGLRLDTAANPRSPWVTFGSSSSGTPYQGPFGKSTGGINVGQVYIGWRPENWADIVLGKMPNPLYTTPMLWDTDLNPEGAAEKFKYAIGEADVFANFGQFLYQDTNPTRSADGYHLLGNGSSSLPFLLAWQVGVNYHITKELSAKVAPVLYNYTGRGFNSAIGSFGGGTPDFAGTYQGQGSTMGISGGPPGNYNLANNSDGFLSNQTGVNDLLVIDIPWEVNYKFNRYNARLFGDFAYNLQGSRRAQDAYAANQLQAATFPGTGLEVIPAPQSHDVKAYQIGFDFGTTGPVYGPMQGLVYGTASKKNTWEFRTYWQHIEQYALDPNLIDSDFFEGRENLEGMYAAFAYCFTDNIIGTARYGYAHRINKNLGTGGSNQDIPQMNPIDHYNLIQVDCTFRF